MWKQLLAPTLLVAGLWTLVSPVTTYFIYWLDQSHQEALTRNLASMHAAGEIREYIWRTLSYASSEFDRQGSEDLQLAFPDMKMRIDRSIDQLSQAAISAEDRQLVSRLRADWQVFQEQLTPPPIADFRSGMRRFRVLRERAKAISNAANEVREVNQQLWLATEQHREHWKGIILTARFVLIIVGPAMGLALGWWISQRVHRSISQINIILKDASVDWEEKLVQLRLSGREDLHVVRERVEKVIERMKQVSNELAASRRETLRSERLAAVGQLAAGVAHELRNPLTSVKLLLQHAAQRPGDTHLNDDETCVVIDEILRMENTIQGLLDFARPPTSHFRLYDFRETVQRALHLVQGRARQQHVQIQVALPHEPVIIDGDPEQLHQVCVNLLINGIEANPGGRVEVRLEERAAESARESAIRLSFRDFGPGIAPDILVHLFEPFVSGKERGTGLGLAISRRIVMQHDGCLTAENHPEGGAVLVLELPAPPPARRTPLLSAAPSTPASASR